MNEEFIGALEELEREKGISKDIIFDALESALVSSYKKNFGTSQNVQVEINRENGNINLFALKEVVSREDFEDENLQIEVDRAKSIDPKIEIGDIYTENIKPNNFGRIAAQTAKQVVIQRIKDAERDIIFEDFTDRENEIITGQVQRVSYGSVYFDLGKTEAVLPPAEQIKNETYHQSDRFKLLLVEVKKTTKGPQIILSRSHPNLVKRLFELEVPEILEGIVEIYSIAREAGSRTKIAVYSKDPDVDPLGACVGYKGSRVKAIVDELHDEKIDIVIFEKSIDKFIANALSPSKVEKVFVNEKEKSAIVVVPDYQLSLAIGKEGQNARLAAKLTNWKIDIKSDSQFEQYLKDEDISEKDLLEKFIVKDIVSEEEENKSISSEEVLKLDIEDNNI
ncbi:MAG: transcription termination factor NusA [Peptoniphilaceae bacterium]